MDELQEIIAAIDGIRSLEDEREAAALDVAVDALFKTPYPERGMDVLFKLLERFPEASSYKVLWGVLQRIEELPGYEVRLIESVRRQPGWFNVMMVQRLMNAGRREVEGMKLIEVLQEVVTNPRGSSLTRQDAQRFVEWQQRQAQSPS